MARYRVLMWREIPTAIQARDATGAKVKRAMPKWFMHEISRTTLREGLQGSDDYTAEFEWSRETERDGTAEEVVDAVYAELCAKFGRDLTGRRLERRSDREAAAAARSAAAEGAEGAEDDDEAAEGAGGAAAAGGAVAAEPADHA